MYSTVIVHQAQYICENFCCCQILGRHSRGGVTFDLRGLAWEFRLELIQIFVIELTLHCMNLQSIIYLQTLLSLTEEPPTADLVFLLANVALWLLRAHASYWISCVKAHIRTTLIYTVHCTSIGLAADTARGQSIPNLMFNDTADAVDGLVALVAAWRLPIEFSSSLYVLWTNLTYGVIPCLLMIVVLRSAALALSIVDGSERWTWQARRDERINLCEEAFTPPACGTLARLGWTRIWVQLILRSRERELTLLGRREWMRKIREGIDYAQPLMVQFVAALVMITTTSVQPAAVVPMSLMLGNVAAPMNQFPGVILSLLDCRSALQRLHSFSVLVPVRACAQDKPEFTLDPRFEGRVVVIDVKNGATLAAKLLASSTNTAVVRQTPQLLTGCGDTVRDNIFFGLKRDDACLDSAMRLACLRDLPVSKKVETLSMGQGARVCLARAYYRILSEEARSTVLVLEEPCISLDSRTSTMVIANLVELLKHTTSIVVSTDHAEALVSNLPREVVFVASDRPRTSGQESYRVDSVAPIGNAVNDSVPEWEKEYNSRCHSRCVPLDIYLAFLAYVGNGYTYLIMVLIAGIMATQHFLEVFFSRVANGERELLWSYAAFLTVFLMCNFGAFQAEVSGGLRGANKLFAEFVSDLPQYAISLDAVGGPDTLSRLTSDVNVVDHTLTRTLGVLWGAVLYLLFKAAFMVWTSQNWRVTMSMILLVCLAFEMIAAGPFRPANRGVHRRAAAALTPVMAAAHGSFEVRDTIRSYNAASWVADQFLVNATESARWQLLEDACRCWLSLRLEIIGFFLTVQATFGRRTEDPILAGMWITTARAVSGIVQQLIHNCADIERDFVSVQRLADDPFPGQKEVRPVQEEKISGGTIVIRKATVGYGDAIILEGVNLVVNTSEKLALVGPSGAGKTTLLNTILGATRVFNGSVCICGVSPRQANSSLVVQCVPHSPVLFRGSLRQNLDPEGGLVDNLLYDALFAVGLPELASKNLECEASDIVNTTGDRIRLCLARVVLARRFGQLRVILLDECAGVFPDESAKRFVGTCLRLFEEQTVIMTTHRRFLMTLFDRIVTIE